jgi:arylsulfatase A-like enzyme
VPERFAGKIELDIRDSVPDWEPFLAERAPEGAPNVLVILYDDTGLAAWEPFGGRIQMPTLQRLAEGGLTYSQWHTTSLCAPTRSCFLTGRNCHQNGFGQIAEGATGFPGYNSHLPADCVPMAKLLRDAGWSTFWVGKDHNVPIDEFHMGASKQRWPLGMGYDRFYGFLGGETDQWHPDLVADNHHVEQPYAPEDGYHLSKDLADRALEFVRDSKQAAPEKPWYLWLCPGANHAPHHAPQEYLDKYRGAFDDGYEAYREWALARMIERGVMPEGTELTPINPLPSDRFLAADAVRPWDSLSDDERRLFARLAEAYAAFSEYTDVQMGRVIDYLQESGQLDNTLILYCADNGASGEGTPNGSVNENKFFNAWPDAIEDNLAQIDEIGSPSTYNHYPTGWAVAFSTPFKMFKRYSHAGGSCAPMVIHWPAGITARGEIRHQYHHANDVVPTILDVCGVEMPAVYEGAKQTPLPGVSMRYSFHDAAAPTRKRTQYYEMTGTRGLWHEGWKVVATHGSQPGIGHFDSDPWELYHVDKDRSEARDLAAEHPEKVDELVRLWLTEAERNRVLPLNDLTVIELLTSGVLYHEPVSPSGRYDYYPGTSSIPEQTAANTHGVSWRADADIDFTPDSEGVIFAHGSRFAGHALLIKDGQLHYVYNFLGIPPEQRLTFPAPATGRHTVTVEFVKESIGEHREAHGTATLRIDDADADSAAIRTCLRFSLSGEGLCIGYDDGDAVSSLYRPRFPFTGGTLHKVTFHVGEDLHIDREQHLHAAIARD